MKRLQLMRILSAIPHNPKLYITVDEICYPIRQAIRMENGEIFLTANTPQLMARKRREHREKFLKRT